MYIYVYVYNIHLYANTFMYTYIYTKTHIEIYTYIYLSRYPIAFGVPATVPLRRAVCLEVKRLEVKWFESK